MTAVVVTAAVSAAVVNVTVAAAAPSLAYGHVLLYRWQFVM